MIFLRLCHIYSMTQISINFNGQHSHYIPTICVNLLVQRYESVVPLF